MVLLTSYLANMLGYNLRQPFPGKASAGMPMLAVAIIDCEHGILVDASELQVGSKFVLILLVRIIWIVASLSPVGKLRGPCSCGCVGREETTSKSVRSEASTA